MKLKISDVEEKLGKKIRKEAVSLGFDVAERFTGYCSLQSNQTEITIEDIGVIETDTKQDTVHRMDCFLNSLEKFKQDWGKFKTFKIVVIEDCFMGMNVFTLKHLARFSALVYVSFRKQCDSLMFLMPNSARSIVGFNKNTQMKETKLEKKVITKGKNKGKEKKIDLKKLVQEYLFTTFNIKLENPDQSDAFVLALAGLLK
jgi:Holliday junction resolvasome RuvABC endonuclease subunit